MNGVDCRLYQIIAGFIIKYVADHNKKAISSIANAFILLDFKKCGKISKQILKYCIFLYII